MENLEKNFEKIEKITWEKLPKNFKEFYKNNFWNEKNIKVAFWLKILTLDEIIENFENFRNEFSSLWINLKNIIPFAKKGKSYFALNPITDNVFFYKNGNKEFFDKFIIFFDKNISNYNNFLENKKIKIKEYNANFEFAKFFIFVYFFAIFLLGCCILYMYIVEKFDSSIVIYFYLIMFLFYLSPFFLLAIIYCLFHYLK